MLRTAGNSSDPGARTTWRGEFPEFSEALKRGKDIADDAIEATLFRRATGYNHDVIKIITVSVGQGCSEIREVPYVEHHPPDTTAAIFWLKNRRPKDWRDKQEVDLGVQDSLGDFLAALDGRNKGVPSPGAA